MPEFKLQRFRGGWAVAVYEDGKRISRRQLVARDAAGAAQEFNRVVAVASRPVDPTVREVWEAYLADRVGRKIVQNMGWTAGKVLPFFGHLKPNEITAKLCRAYAAERRKAPRGPQAQQERRAKQGKPLVLGVTDGTIRTELNQLRAAMLWGVKHGLLSKAPMMDMPPVSKPRERHLTHREFEALLDAAEAPHLKLYLLLAISTAGRNAALLEVTWRQIDFERGNVHLGDPLALRPRKGRATVPMTNELRAALSVAKAQATTTTDRVIEYAGRPVASVRTTLTKAAKRAGVKGVTPHVLRHTAAVWMAEAGHSMSEIAAVLGHSDDAITQRVYAHLSPTHLRGAVSALENRRGKL